MSEQTRKDLAVRLEQSQQTGENKIARRVQTGREKISRNPVTFDPDQPRLRKPPWIRVRLPAHNRVQALKARLRENHLISVCEEASCPNIHECFSKGTATFMVLGPICTRRCAFCNVAHGRPNAPDRDEPEHLAQTIHDMGLQYVVITSVDRDDLRDGGGGHFARCIEAVRAASPGIRIEVLVPDFRGKNKINRALDALGSALPDVFNHNLETVRRLYRQVRPGADYGWSLQLLRRFKAEHPGLPTKSGIMVGLGETFEEVEEVFADLRAHDVDMVTVGQYLQPSRHHHPVIRYWEPREFDALARLGEAMRFSHVASGPLVRSSYHADLQADKAGYAA